MRKERVLPYLLIAVGIGMVIVGLYRQEADLILSKAINICLECVGIG